MDSAAYKAKFMKQINSSFGSGGMALAMSEAEFQCFILFLKSTTKMNGMPIRMAASVIGLQQCGKISVFGKDIQVIIYHGEAFIYSSFTSTVVCVCII